MNAYLPTDYPDALIAVAALGVVLILGYFVTRISRPALARSVAWLMVLTGVAGMDLFTAPQPAGFRMLTIIGMLLFTMKVVVTVEVHLSGKARLSFWQWIGFAGLWVGMRPALFAKVPRQPRPQVNDYFLRGAKNLVLGLMLVMAARGVWLASTEWHSAWRWTTATALLLPGLSLMLHFGAFNLLTGCWRWLGADCDTLFREPLKSKSLTEFWGKRWNLAFSEMTTLAVYRPLRGALGNSTAMLFAFVFSGLLHELAISFPVRAGYGWPLLYFALHGVGMLLESRWPGLAERFQQRPSLGWWWTMAWIVLPLPILFHQPFLQGCVWPIIGIE